MHEDRRSVAGDRGRGAARPADQPVTAEVLERVTRERAIDVRAGDIVLLRCFAGEIGERGWAECRGLAKDAAEWLRDRRVKTVGVDLGTVDDHTDMVRPAHLALRGASIILLENVANVSQVGQDRRFFVGLPLKIRSGTGSPIRAVALTGDLSPLPLGEG
jgi:kynurenine formamidase